MQYRPWFRTYLASFHHPAFYTLQLISGIGLGIVGLVANSSLLFGFVCGAITGVAFCGLVVTTLELTNKRN
jgi:hypothetical protein